MNFLKKLSFGAALCALGSAVHAAVPADIDGIVTDATTLFEDVAGVVVTIVAFGILIFIVRKVRGR